MTLGDWVTLAAIAGVILAVIFGRKRGKMRMEAALSAAAEGGRAQAEAELTARLTNQVIVSAGNVSPSQEMGDEVLLAALRRIATGSTDDGARADDDHYFGALNDRARLVGLPDPGAGTDELAPRRGSGHRNSWADPHVLDRRQEVNHREIR